MNVSSCFKNSTNVEKSTSPPKKLDPLTNDSFMLIIKEFEKQRNKDREMEKLQREKERKEDIENFELECKRNLEQLKIELSLPP